MHAFLVIGGTKNKRHELIARRLTDWHIAPSDRVTLVAEGEHITIDDVRTFARRLLLAPMESPYTAGVIYEATLLTNEAQHALLKLLEEPPPNAYILGETESADQLLPTIVSRCEIVRVSGESESEDDRKPAIQTIQSLLVGSPADIFSIVDAHAVDRGEAKQWVRTLLSAARQMLVVQYKKPSATDPQKIVKLIRKLQKAQAQLAVNCNPKLVLDRVFLAL